MDKSQHSKLSQVFEQAAEQEAQAHPLPEQLWHNIAQQLTTNPPVESGQSIQQAFEEQVVPDLPPVNLWSTIAKQLDQNKIKESFEEQPSPEAPAAVWNDIEQQLEIETVWKKVHKALDRRTNWLYWREKLVQGSLILLILLWLRGCEWREQPQPPVVSTPVAIVSNTTPPTEKVIKNPRTASPINSMSTKESTIVNNNSTQQVVEGDQQAATNLLTNSSQQSAKKSKSTVVIKKKAAVTNNTSSTANPEQGATVFINKNNIQPFEWQDLAATATKEEKPKEQQQGAEENLAPSKEFLQANSILKGKEPITNNTLANAPLLLLHNWVIAINTVPTVPTPEAVTNPSIVALEAIDLERVQQQHQKQPTRVEFGVQTRVKGTMLLGDMTTEAMERTSMVKTKVMPTVGVGANLAWYLTHNDALVVALHPMANSRQYFGGYTEEGRYYHKEIKLSYFDAELGYQRTLFHYNDFGVLPSTVYARFNYGFGYLNKGETILNGMAIDETAVYNTTNHSFGLALGNTHRLKRWVVDYGIYGQVGMSTIHRQQPTDYRHLLGVGAYLGLRYVL